MYKQDRLTFATTFYTATVSCCLMMKKLLLPLFMIVYILVIDPAIVWARGDIATIYIEVDKQKASEKSWDVSKGAPDIAICVSNELVGTMCLPEGDSINSVINAECKDSYKCRFSALIPNDEFKIYVVDVDLVLNDIIGTGHCRRGETCTIGQAIVEIK